MFKKSPSRNQRSKGIKIKHVLQICLLLGICFWLIYQVKRSHDKRKEFDEKDAKASVKAQSGDVILKFGRKDLPHVQEVSKNYKHEEEEEEEDGVEEKNKHDEEQEEKAKRLEEEEQEGASKHEEEEQEGGKHEEEEQEGGKHEEEEQEGGKHEEEEQEGGKHEEEEQEGGKHEEEEQEGGKHEEEDQEEGSKHEEEGQEEASKHEEEEQEEVQEDEGSKHDDEEEEAEIKDEEAEDEGRVDDEVDENEQEKVDGEADHEEEFLDEEKEREAEGDDKENEDKENEEKEGQEESDNLVNDQNHDGGGRNAHEAREEHYKADDASSAVSHDTQIINSEADKLDMENSNDSSTMNVLEQERKANTTQETNGDENKSELKVDEGKYSEGGRSLNVTYTKENYHETGSSNSVYISLPNTTNTTDFIDQASNNFLEVSKEIGNNPAEVNTEVPGSLQNGTSAQNTTEDGMITEEKYKEQANEMISNNKQPDSNIVDSSKIENVATTDSSNSSTDAEFGMSEDIAKRNVTAEGDSFGSSMTKEFNDSTQNEKSGGDNESGGTDESSDNSSSNETVDGGQHDPIDSSDNTLPQDEKDARVDLSTLPDITTEGSNNEDAAAE